MVVISKQIDEFMMQEGYLKMDLPQIERCFHLCTFRIARLPKNIRVMKTEDYDTMEYRKCSRQKALNVLGWQEFWLGLGRTAFHASTTRRRGQFSIQFSWDFWKYK